MPQKSKSPRKPGPANRAAKARATRRKVSVSQTHPRDGLHRHRRTNLRMPNLPGRHGNR